MNSSNLPDLAQAPAPEVQAGKVLKRKPKDFSKEETRQREKKSARKAAHQEERKQRFVDVPAKEMALYEGVFQGTVKILEELPLEMDQQLRKPQYQLLDGKFMEGVDVDKLRRIKTREEWDLHVGIY